METIYFSNMKEFVHPFYHKKLVFTGALEKMTRSSAVKLVTNCGGTVLGAVTEQVDYVILGNKRKGMSSKELKARQLQHNGHPVEIINEADFFWLLAHSS